MTTVAPCFAEGARRGLLLAAASEEEGPDAPRLVVLDAYGNVDSMTPGAEQWLEELPDGSFGAEGKLPSAVLASPPRQRGPHAVTILDGSLSPA